MVLLKLSVAVPPLIKPCDIPKLYSLLWVIKEVVPEVMAFCCGVVVCPHCKVPVRTGSKLGMPPPPITAVFTPPAVLTVLPPPAFVNPAPPRGPHAFPAPPATEQNP